MRVEIKVEATAELKAIFARLGNTAETAFRLAAQSLYDFLRDYHSKTTWRGEHWMAGPNSGEFARKVVEGWQPPFITGTGFTAEIRNTFGLLAWKVTGGAIYPRKALYLTIPLVSAAKGLPARQYQASTNQRLFKAGNALCRRIGKQLEAIYALKEFVVQKPWPNALPSDEAIEQVVERAVETYVKGTPF